APRPPQAAMAPAAPPHTGPSPEGSGCASAVARYRSVLDNDLAMGHVNRSVYDQIQGEISAASSSCAAGDDARAMSLLRASKSKHGYPG
ncbi:MAG: hypothetical protein N2444_02380, partial [Methylocystis sp.]|nr:hypothetical protein [Methylocystis sp.]